MTIEVSIVIAGISLAFAIYSGISNMKRSQKQQIASETSQLTTVIIKLENIGNDITEMKTDLRDIRAEVRENSADIIRMKQQIKALEKTVFGPSPEVIRYEQPTD